MNILSIDTALHSCGVGVMVDGNVVFSENQSMSRGQDQALVKAVGEALDKSNLSLNDLDAITITTGPGSFTGIRIGLAFARGLVAVLKIPLIGLTTSEVLVVQIGGTGITIIEIKKDAYIAQTFDKGIPQSELASFDQQGLKDFVAQQNKQKIVTHSTNISNFLGSDCLIHIPNPEVMLTIAQQRIKDGSSLNHIARPVYIRSADVTIKN